jgi:predicted DCC family thiol-disulfide oxidoreductase YuxK
MQARSLASKFVLAYDAYCGPCRRFRQAVDILDKHEKIDFISLTNADQAGLLDKIYAPLRYKSFHLIFPDGEVTSGSDALLRLIGILPGGRIISPLIDYFPGGKQMIRLIFAKISRLHDMTSCSIDNDKNYDNFTKKKN